MEFGNRLEANPMHLCYLLGKVIVGYNQRGKSYHVMGGIWDVKSH